jgi:hypothetical protein
MGWRRSRQCSRPKGIWIECTLVRCSRVMGWPRRSRDERDGGGSGSGRSWPKRQEMGRASRAWLREDAARRSRVPGGGVDVGRGSWRDVVFGDIVSGGIVSHPSRQHSGGAGMREAALRLQWASRRVCLYTSCYATEPLVQTVVVGSRARDSARDAGVEWWSSGVVRGDGRMASPKISAG